MGIDPRPVSHNFQNVSRMVSGGCVQMARTCSSRPASKEPSTERKSRSILLTSDGVDRMPSRDDSNKK